MKTGSEIVSSMPKDPKAAVAHLAVEIGLGFHPDTPADDYTLDGRPLFDGEEACLVDLRVTEAFAECDPYEVAIQAWNDAGLLPAGRTSSPE